VNYQVKEMLPIDWEQVKNIYLQGINTGRATFQMEVPTWESWDQNHMKVCRFVAMLKNTILGWVAISPTSTRNAYCG